MSSNKQQTTSSQTQDTQPWNVQQPYLTQAFQGASNALSKAQGATAPTNFTAQFTPDQISAYSKMLGYGTGNDNISGSSANAGASLTGAGANATGQGLFDLANFTPAGGTDSNIAAANKYVAGQNIPAQVQADMLGADQQASEQTLPQIARNAAGSGNVNSSRTAIQNGIVQRGLAQQAAGIGAGLQANAYNTGLGLAEQNSESQNSNLLTKMLGLTSGGNNSVATGVNANTGAVGQQGGLFNIANSGIQGQYQAAQAPLTNQEQQFEAQTNDPYAALNNFYNIIGNRSWGGTTTGSSTQNSTSTPSTLSTIGGILSGVGGFFSMSDRRVKKDIQVIGELFDGTPVYRFRYRHDPTNTLHIGFMAQDIEKIKPEAVLEINGIKHVNYDLATRDSIVGD
jgi:hypothetical protein